MRGERYENRKGERTGYKMPVTKSKYCYEKKRRKG